MSDRLCAGDKLLDSWLTLTSTLWNTRLVTSMTFNEAHVMGILLRLSTPKNPLTATDLIRKTHLLKSQMNKILSTLEDKGYIVRTRSQSDRRMAHILLTSEGEAAYRAQHEKIEALLDKLVERIGSERALRISADLQDIVASLDDLLS